MTARRPQADIDQTHADDESALAVLADAPEDNEPTTDDDLQAVAEAWRAYCQADTTTAKTLGNGSATA